MHKSHYYIHFGIWDTDKSVIQILLAYVRVYHAGERVTAVFITEEWSIAVTSPYEAILQWNLLY